MHPNGQRKLGSPQSSGRGPTSRHAAVALGENIYVIAGIEPDASQSTGVSTIDSVERYNVPKDEWSFVAPLPIPMNHANAIATNGKIHVLGGLSGGAAFWALPNCYEYDPVTNKWTELPSMPKDTERGISILGAYGGKIIVAGGITGGDGLQETVDIVSSYNIKTQEWETLSNLPESREHAGGGVFGNSFYVVGGRVRSQTAVRDTVYVLDLKTLEWSEPILGQRIYTFGGEGNLDPEGGFVFNETEVYDIRGDCWEKVQPMNTPRHGMAAVAFNGSIYTPGGGIRDFDIVDNMEVLHPGSFKW
ncbi:Kelch-like protein terF [Colletotrichum gloeosporioides]|uniref:Kelch-like protein terF n=1 Tax=Colletotrichum gloeosporioides TaxID=474922 RepID=A0A8H4CDV4_COLGL|nr:Kelch-like protein terF [Colletotrichum gloeosporioides]KAF3802200.1 Kelch-like protein terF [Colletotrichum gloeosporioides]